MNSFVNTDIRLNQQVATTYVCGSKKYTNIYINLKLHITECGKNQDFRPRDNLICKECNGRIFYKKRTRKPVQFEAR